MKQYLRKTLFHSLAELARMRIEKSGAQIIGITGSKGKSSVKEAIASVLSEDYKIFKSPKNLNTEFGLCLALLGYEQAPKNILAYLPILVRSTIRSFFTPPSYDFLVLEMGIDKPGDMDLTLELFHPDVMIFLNVFEEHMGEGKFQSKEEILFEKGKACRAVDKEGLVILNLDDPLHSKLAAELDTPIQWFSRGGTKNKDCSFIDNIRSNVDGLKAQFHLGEDTQDIHLTHMYGKVNASLALVATMLGKHLGMKWDSIEKGLKKWRLPKGRLSRLEGVRSSILLDSTYNANPDSMTEALEILSSFKGRKIAALGSMNELGKDSDEKHQKIGQLAAQSADELIFVGHSANQLKAGAEQAKVQGRKIHCYESSLDAADALEKMLNSGDVALIKGSQGGVRMEHVTKACLLEPEKAPDLLVRQGRFWLNHPLA